MESERTLPRLAVSAVRVRRPGVGSSRPGSSRIKVLPWQGEDSRVLVGPRGGRRLPSSAELHELMDRLRAEGVVAAFTPALSPRDAEVFRSVGFRDQERLHLLSRSLDDEPPPPVRSTSIGRRWHERRVLAIDAKAFEGFWQFDQATLRESRRATPRSRYRVLHDEGRLVGYAVCGRAGSRGYLQRLAVDPDVHGRGHGSSLVLDALGWLKRSGAASVLVNTQETNHRALGLYRHLGFRSEPDGLVVLGWTP